MFSLNRTLGLLVILSASFLSTEALAVEKRYVTDKLFVQLRSGPSTQNRIITRLPSGEHLIYISEENNFTQVKTDKGQTGWVSSGYLVDEPIAKEKLILTNQEMAKLKAELAEVKQQKNDLEEAIGSLQGDKDSLDQSNRSAQEELNHIKNISRNALALDEKVKTLSKRNQELDLKVETLSAENQQLKNDNRNTYLLYGGLLIILGIVAGLILPSLRTGKRNTGGWA